MCFAKMHHSSKSAHDGTKISTVCTEFAVNIQNILKIIIIIMLVYSNRIVSLGHGGHI